MISLPSLLTNTRLVAAAVGAFIFLLAAWVSTHTWIASRQRKISARAGGFLLLAIGSTLFGVGSENTAVTIFTVAALLVGALAIIASFVIDRPEQKQTDAVKQTTQDTKIDQVVKGPPEDTSSALPALPASSASNSMAQAAATAKQSLHRPPASSSEQSATPRLAPASMTPPENHHGRKQIGLRTEVLVKLPKVAKRRRARFVVVIIGLAVTAAATLGVIYILYTRTHLFGGEQSTEEAAFVEETPVAAPPTPTPEPSPAAAAKPMVTILATETGYLNVRDGDDTTTPVITKINPGEEYELLGENEAGDWYKLQVGEDTAGWVAARYVEKNAE